MSFLLFYCNFIPQLEQNFAPFVGVPHSGQNYAPAGAGLFTCAAVNPGVWNAP